MDTPTEKSANFSNSKCIASDPEKTDGYVSMKLGSNSICTIYYGDLWNDYWNSAK